MHFLVKELSRNSLISALLANLTDLYSMYSLVPFKNSFQNVQRILENPWEFQEFLRILMTFMTVAIHFMLLLFSRDGENSITYLLSNAFQMSKTKLFASHWIRCNQMSPCMHKQLKLFQALIDFSLEFPDYTLEDLPWNGNVPTTKKFTRNKILKT